MHKKTKIRVLALGIILNKNRIFVSQSYDSHKQENFYRALGGGVEFGETSYQALQREFQEEIQAELTNIKYLGCLESIFTCNGQPGHEILQIYQADFVDPNFYQLEQVIFYEKDRQETAVWVEMERFQLGELKLVPEGFLDLVK